MPLRSSLRSWAAAVLGGRACRSFGSTWSRLAKYRYCESGSPGHSVLGLTDGRWCCFLLSEEQILKDECHGVGDLRQGNIHFIFSFTLSCLFRIIHIPIPPQSLPYRYVFEWVYSTNIYWTSTKYYYALFLELGIQQWTKQKALLCGAYSLLGRDRH